MVKQYPHIAVVTVTGEATKAGNGDLVPGSSTTVSFNCRVEANNGNGYVAGVDGAKIDYSWKLYCGKEVSIIPVGASIVVSDNGVQLCSDTVKQFYKGQLNCKMWL